jgi:hypothetical protein
MLSAVFEPAIPASDRPQILALDRSTTGIRSLDRPARCESLYRLRCRGSHEIITLAMPLLAWRGS